MKHIIIGITVCVLFFGGILAYKFFQSDIDKHFRYQTSDASNIKGTITISLDSWIGYFPFQSPVFKKLMKQDGYLVNIINDNANYNERIKALKAGKSQFATATIDSYILNGIQEDFPATIISVIDESIGGDALIGKKSKYKNLNDIKNDFDKIAFTLNSPSEHLMKSIITNFGLNIDENKKLKTNGSKDALKLLQSGKTDLAILWEPEVSKALENPDYIKIIGSDDVKNLIVDVLLVNRKYAVSNKKEVSIVLSNYFKTLKIYKDDKIALNRDIQKLTRQSEKNINSMLNGLEWTTLSKNTTLFETIRTPLSNESLTDIILFTVDILDQNGDISKDDINIYTLVNSDFIEKLTYSDLNDIEYKENQIVFKILSKKEWLKLKEVGTLKLKPISFTSGTSNLDNSGKEQLDLIAEQLKRYPKFRILIKGHTGTRGNKKANQELSQIRADQVRKYFIEHYDIDKNRIFSIGFGGSQPLKRLENESFRSYKTRLKRVEITLMSKDI